MRNTKARSRNAQPRTVDPLAAQIAMCDQILAVGHAALAKFYAHAVRRAESKPRKPRRKPRKPRRSA